MRIQKFTVSKYRSIIRAKNITMGKYTVLVGKNNEGKSNLIRALNLAMNNMSVIVNDNISPIGKGWNINNLYRYSDNSYSYDIDFPKNIAARTTDSTVIQLHFDLTEDDISNFRKELNLQTNNDLTLLFKYDENNILDIRVAKRGGRNWQGKIVQIMRFIVKNISFTYIPAVRTADTFNKIIRRELSRAITDVAHNEEYEELLIKLKRLEQNAVDKIADKITPELIEWLPSTTAVRIEIDERTRRISQYIRNANLYITSSGTETLLENKGDGVQSLFALALLANRNISSNNTILAIDEPEAHLHPEAIHRLQQTISDLSDNGQVIVATHNPIFVNKNDEGSNIIVDSGSVRKAKNIREIRDILGVEVDDNLTNANSTLAVEGVTDKIFLNTFIQIFGDQRLKNKIKSGSINIFPMHGVTKIKYNAQMFKNSMVNFIFVIDNDNGAQNLIDKLIKEHEISQKEYIFIPKKPFKREAELEDLYSNEFVSNVCENILGVDIKSKLEYSNRAEKWSERMKKILPEVGKDFNEETERIIKEGLSNEIKKSEKPERNLSDDGKKFTYFIINQIENFFD
ncbi:ATP-dependent nuclease [Companilactobacillus paralimentarius]|uniref:ATP-dependent nuclease n=1 Tax=Companilactobacillus paralimentarius TaxID=83526 RepID=UPI00384FE116